MNHSTRISIGLILITVSGMLLIPRLIRRPVHSQMAEISIMADGNGRGASWEDDIKIDLRAPQQVAEGSSFNIQLDYARDRYPAGSPENITFTLISTAFDYKPSGSVAAPTCYAGPGDSEGASAEKRFVWNLAPLTGKTGKQELFIEIGGLDFNRWKEHTPSFPTTLKYLKNGAETSTDEILRNVVPIEIQVTTIYGIPKYIVSIIQAVMSLVGFVLAYPVIVEHIKKSITSKRTRHTTRKNKTKV